MSFATPSMTRGAHMPTQTMSMPNTHAAIDYRNGFSVPLPGPVVRPMQTDIHLDGAHGGDQSRTISVSYAPYSAPAVDMTAMANTIAQRMAAERRAELGSEFGGGGQGYTLGAAASHSYDNFSAPSSYGRQQPPTTYDSVAPSAHSEAQLRSVAANQRAIHEQMASYKHQMSSVSSEMAQQQDRIGRVENMRAELASQMQRLEGMATNSGSGAGLESLRMDVARQGAALQQLAAEVSSSQQGMKSMGAGLMDHRASIDSVSNSVNNHAADLEHLNSGMRNHTEHLVQLRDGMSDHTNHLGTVLDGMTNHTTHITDLKSGMINHTQNLHQMKAGLHDHKTHIGAIRNQNSGFSDTLGSMHSGLQNHSQHIEMMRDGLLHHKDVLSTGAGAGSPDVSMLMQELQDMKVRVDSLDRAAVGRLSSVRERTGPELVDLMQRRH